MANPANSNNISINSKKRQQCLVFVLYVAVFLQVFGFKEYGMFSRNTNTRKQIRGAKSTTSKVTSIPLLSEDGDDDEINKRTAEQQQQQKKSSSSSFSSFLVNIPPSTFFILLALQCGFQPVAIKLFMPTEIVRSTAVLAQEGVKLVISILFLITSNQWTEVTQGWTLQTAFIAAGVPAGLYVIQNYANVMATQTLPPVVFIVLNQTKTLSTAFCCFLIVGQKQSPLQILALFLVACAALIIQKVIPLDPCQQKLKDGDKSNNPSDDKRLEAISEEGDNQNHDTEWKKPLMDSNGDEEVTSQSKNDKQSNDSNNEEAIRAKRHQFQWGVMPALLGSFLSGLAGTLAQRTLQQSGRSPHLFNSELALFSSSFLVGSLLAGSPDYHKMKSTGCNFFHGWTWKTWIPIASNAMGAILVGLVTKYQGAVVKGFAMIFGMAISGVLQQIYFANTKEGGVTLEQIVGGSLGALSLWMHISYQP